MDIENNASPVRIKINSDIMAPVFRDYPGATLENDAATDTGRDAIVFLHIFAIHICLTAFPMHPASTYGNFSGTQKKEALPIAATPVYLS
uniref:Uncharacterized protein n=1 Tax=viral metagenome TaxID=1070528 RepID=A0A6M3JQE6_9ZZZZ